MRGGVTSREPLSLVAVALGVSACIEGTALEVTHTFNNFEATGTVTLDGAPLVRAVIKLSTGGTDPEVYTTRSILQQFTSASGAFDFAGNVHPGHCDRMWLVIDGLSPAYRHPVPGCREHSVDMDASINTRVTGTVTLDGNPAAGSDISLAVDQMDPSGLVLRRLGSAVTSPSGQYSFEERVAPDFCDKLWVWWPSQSVDHAKKLPGCGTHAVDLAATTS